MSAAVWVFILTFSTLNGVVSGDLRRPTNVQLSSRNLNLMLTWEPPAGAPSGLVYSTQYTSSATSYRRGCVNTTALQCDLTSFNISVYGIYRGKVQALLGAETSDWVESNQTTLDKDTQIGPPIVSLLSNGPILVVSIKDPVFQISSLRTVYSVVSYIITYWKKGQEDQPTNIGNIEQDRVFLEKLDPLSEYCVQVHINTIRNKNPSEPSSVICERTGNNEEPPWVAAVIVFIIMVVAVALIVVTVLKWKSISQFFWPKVSLPQHFEESLLVAPESSLYLASQPTEEIDPVSVVTAEEDCPLGTAESSCSKQPNGAVGDG
ncbi:interleukin-10 receptor subunit beta-like [Girardinichthys multiradiatus]|uniref:interleukin-10 receptor subunit beta-like n=1 Tax=Girardinichthys multiradiatus TaxID=208333 RepID=UPI001FAC3522|nr:interleukin-10 receptor subunit beta-like [Girardinichthys multiradiatus]